MKIQKTKWAKVLPWILVCAAGLALLVLAVVKFITQSKDYSKASDLYEDTNKEYVISHIDKLDKKPASSVTKKDEVEDKSGWEYLAEVDITKLREVNKDIAGWILFENIDISYPVLYSGDNDKYLRRAYTGEYMSAGSIFIEGKNSKDFSDAHTIIYGHNMNDLSMFGQLENYVTERDYLADHEYFQIITEKEKLRYKIISYKIVGDDNDIYTVYQNGGQNFINFVKKDVQGGSFMEIGYDINPDDHLITLSTCFKDDRLVVSAVRCGEYRFD